MFMYKLKKGSAEQSFAGNVARLVGLPDSVIKTQSEKGKAMEL